MYADDTTVFLRDTESISQLLKLLNQFRTVSGLEVNASKTEAMWLGQWKNRRDTPFNFNWSADPICALGVFFSYDTAKANKLNFDEKMRSMEKILNIWKNRKLTLIGSRINIVKTLALPNMIFNFIWENKPPKIKKMTIIGEKNKGGLKMLDFPTMETALKIAWVNRIHHNCHSSWKILIEHFFRQYGGLSFLINYRYDFKLLHLNTVPPFYHAILKYWQENKPNLRSHYTKAKPIDLEQPKHSN